MASWGERLTHISAEITDVKRVVVVVVVHVYVEMMMEEAMEESVEGV